jgi:dihydroorotase
VDNLIVDLVLTNARAYLKGEVVDCNLAIEDGRIQKIGKETNMPKADEKTDLHGLLVLPGVIDSHVHLRDEGNAYKETFYTGTCAAAAGGVTTVLDMPNNSPVTMSSESLAGRMQKASYRVIVNVGFYSEFPTNLDEIQEIVEAGAMAYKLFMGEQVGGQNVDDDEAITNAFEKAGEFSLPVAVHAEDHAYLKPIVERFKLERRDGLQDFLKAHDEGVEVAAVERAIDLSAQAKNVHLHFCHLSTEKALRVVAEAKKSTDMITCEATPHHLLLTKTDFERLGTKALTLPPLRTKENVNALWNGVIQGVIDTIGSDHAPHDLQEKDGNGIWDVKPGIAGLETSLPLVLTMVHKERLTLNRAIQLLCEEPAEVFKLTSRGHIQQQETADLVAVDFNYKYQIDASKFKSKAKYSPFDKWEVQGKPMKTYVSGQLVMDEDEIIAKPGSGTIIRRSKE